MSNNIDQCILKLKFDRPLSRNVKAKDLRGAIASRNKDNSLLHQHATDGEPIYKYPLVQYKIIKGEGFLVGFNEGAKTITNLEILNERFEFCAEKYILLQNELIFHSNPIGTNKEFLHYHFLSLWLALNEENYQKYMRMDKQEKNQLLSKILIGNILSMSKGLEYVVTEEIKASSLDVHEVPARLKGVPMIGFMGKFKVNFEIPDYLGIGKSVSRGFGTVKKINDMLHDDGAPEI